MAVLLEGALSNAAIAAVMAVIALVVSRFWKHPALVHALWLLVLAKLVTPPIFDVPVAWPFATDEVPAVTRPVALSNAPGATDRLTQTADTRSNSSAPRLLKRHTVRSAGTNYMVAARGKTAAQAPRTQPSGDVASAAIAAPRFDWFAVLVAVWIAGSVLYLAVLLSRAISFRRWVSKLDRAPVELCRSAEHVARAVGLARSPRIMLAPGRISPMVWGFGARATVLLPRELWRRLGAAQRAALLAHELAHLRRGDPWVRLLELSATAVYWWHPAVWWARRKIHEAEELCCDAFVVEAMSGRARAYADALLAAVEFLSGGPAKLAPAASGIAPVETLQRRLTMIMQGETLRKISIWGRMTLFALAILLLPMSLTWAQEKNDPKVKPVSTAADEDSSEAEATEDEDDGDENDAEAEQAARDVAEEIEEAIEEVAEGIAEALEEFDGQRIAEIIEEVLEAINFERIGETIEEALEGIDPLDEATIEEAVEAALEGLDEEKIEATIEKALEAVNTAEIENAIEKALEGFDEAEIERRVEEALDNIDTVDIKRQIEEALEELREIDIREHIEEALEAIKDADIAKHVEEALNAIRDADIQGAIEEALEGLDEEKIRQHAAHARDHAEHARDRSEHAREHAEHARERGRERARQGRERADQARRRAQRDRDRDEARRDRKERQRRDPHRADGSDSQRRKEKLERRFQRLEKELDAIRRQLDELSEEEKKSPESQSPDEA